MTEPKLSYLGAPPVARLGYGDGKKARKIPYGFLVVVVLPTLLAAIYFLLIASPRYVSEAQFVVRTPAQQQPSSLGAALQGVGISQGSSDAFAVHEYMTSRDGLLELNRSLDLREMYHRPGIDLFSRLPRPFESNSFETFHKSFNSYLTVGYESSTGISTIRVEAFTPRDAQRINDALLRGGEQLVNRLNSRASADALAEAETAVQDSQRRLNAAQFALTGFRNREGFIDPASSAEAASEVIGQLTVNVATLRAERSQVAADAPQSPQLRFLDSRIRALQQQIDLEKGRIVGNADSLAPKISTYENLMLEREFADKLLAAATASLNSAQLESRRQRLYLDRIVNPNVPDSPGEPHRILAVLAVLASTLGLYGIGTLIWAGIRESSHS